MEKINNDPVYPIDPIFSIDFKDAQNSLPLKRGTIQLFEKQLRLKESVDRFEMSAILFRAEYVNVLHVN